MSLTAGPQLNRQQVVGFHTLFSFLIYVFNFFSQTNLKNRTTRELRQSQWGCLKLGQLYHIRLAQNRRHGGAYRGRAPQTDCLCPPKRGLYPEEINRLRASGAQIEAQISVFCGLTPDFVTFLASFFFFLDIICFRPEKPLEFPISARKYLKIFAPHLVRLIQTGINFSCPRAPLEFTQNKLLVPPPKFISAPQSRYPRAGPGLALTPFFLTQPLQRYSTSSMT